MKTGNPTPNLASCAMAAVAVALIVPSLALGNRTDDATDRAGVMAAAMPHESPAAKPADRQAGGTIETSAAATHVEVVGDFGGKAPGIVLLGPDGSEIYRTEPVRNRTVVARDAIVPSITVRDEPGATTKLIVVAAEEPGATPALRIGKAVNE